MKQITVDTTIGSLVCPVYDPYGYDLRVLDQFSYAPVVSKFDQKYINIPCAFDIETTNINDPQRPYAFMYQWQFCIDNVVFMGRTWSEYMDFCAVLKEKLFLCDKRRLVVYIHNLPFEFQFMRRFFSWSDMFLKGKRNPLKCVADHAIEYRDSYALSNMNLRKFCENTPDIVFMKNDGESYGYDKIRTPETELTPEELSYCYCDVAGLCECIRYRMHEDNLAKIPMTSTGYVRRDFRNEYKKNKALGAIMRRTRLTPELYRICRETFRGGDTHASSNYVGLLLNDIQSYDISSSYPAAMLLDKYPVTAFSECDPEFWLSHNKMPRYAALLYVEFENLEYIGTAGMPYIAIAKCDSISACRINDNGRLLRCGPDKNGDPGYASMWLTDIDLDIIEHDYTWTARRIGKLYISEYGSLPEEHKRQLMHYFRSKTKLKNVQGKEYEYIKDKNKLNAGFGMMVTDIAKRDWSYTAGDYVAEPVDLEKKLDAYYKNKNSFLRYEQGIWVTANARRRLREMIWKVGADCVYVDTDSVKFRHDHTADFEEYNKGIIERCEAAGYYADDPSGKRHYVGTWEDDGFYDEFKSLGAKRYIVRENGRYKTTIAGVDKKRGAAFFNKEGIDAFENGTTIPDAGHIVAYYNDDLPHWITIEGCRIRTASNVALIEDQYTLGVTNEYWDILQKVLANAKPRG